MFGTIAIFGLKTCLLASQDWGVRLFSHICFEFVHNEIESLVRVAYEEVKVEEESLARQE